MKKAAKTVGLPGLQGSEHIGITVPDLEQAVLFLTNVIGCEFVFDGGAIISDPEIMRRQLDVHPDASMRDRFLRCGRGVNFEVFEQQIARPAYGAAPQQRHWRSPHRVLCR